MSLDLSAQSDITNDEIKVGRAITKNKPLQGLTCLRIFGVGYIAAGAASTRRFEMFAVRFEWQVSEEGS